MKRYLLLLVPVLLASAAAWAGNSIPPAHPERARQLQRNLDLIETVVDNGLLLSEEEDPLRRAHHCKGLAERFTRELRGATESRDAPRLVELGRHLQALLERGLAANLHLARSRIPHGSTEEKKLEEVRRSTAEMIGKLEEDLQLAGSQEDAADTQASLQQVLRNVQEGKFQVEKAVKARGKGNGVNSEK